ncbi:MAG: hypothetical protein J6M21_07625 [Campylobacter sp.]|nr:hypothetical protein [Campylobacter sp.]
MKTNLKISLAAAAVLTSVVPNLALAADSYTIYYDSVKDKVVYDVWDTTTNTTTTGLELTFGNVDRASESYNDINIDIGDGHANTNSFEDFFGGCDHHNAIRDNYLELKSGIINGNFISGLGLSVRNSGITISGGTIKGNVYGGKVAGGASAYNNITISGGIIEGNVYAGNTSDATASIAYNTITYNGGNVKGKIAVNDDLKGKLFENTLNIGSYTQAKELSAAGIYRFDKINFILPKLEVITSGFTALTLTNQNAYLVNATITVRDLESYINGNTYHLIKSAYGMVVDDTWLTNNQNLTGKEINVISSSQYNLAKGGIYKSSDDKELYISSTTSTEAITGGVFGDDEAGIKDGITVNLANSDYAKLNINIANSATINLTNAHNVGSVISSGSTLDIKGGSTFDTGASIDVKTANFGDSSDAMVMDIYNISALKAKELNFYLPSNVANDETALKVTNSVDLSGTKVNAYLEDATGIKSKDDKIHLIQTGGKLTGFAETNGKAHLTNVNIAGLINVTGKIAVDSTGKNLDLSFNGTPSGSGGGGGSGGATANEGAKTLLETKLSQNTVVNEGANLFVSNLGDIANSANNANSALSANGANSTNSNLDLGKAVAFAFVSGYDKEMTTGSHIDIKGFNANAGIAGNDYFNIGNLTTGLFVEYGKGEYDSFLDDGTKGSGKTEFVGGGAFARFTTLNNFYTEVSGRVGQVKPNTKQQQHIKVLT